METAVLEANWRRLVRTPGTMGCDPPDVAAVLRQEWYGLVGSAISAGQHAAADRAAVRWVPLGKLRYRHQESHGMERWLRAMPWAWERTFAASGPHGNPESRESWLRTGQ